MTERHPHEEQRGAGGQHTGEWKGHACADKARPTG